MDIFIVNKKFIEEIKQDIRNLRDDDSHVCGAPEKPCTCYNYDVVIDKLNIIQPVCLDDDRTTSPEECVYWRRQMNKAVEVIKNTIAYLDDNDYTVSEKNDVEFDLKNFVNNLQT